MSSNKAPINCQRQEINKMCLTVLDKAKRIWPMLDIVLDMSGEQYQCEYQ